MEKASRDRGYFIDGSQERNFVGLRRFVKASDFSDELQRSRSNLFGIDWRIEVEKCFDISAHFRATSRGRCPNRCKPFQFDTCPKMFAQRFASGTDRSEEHTSELQLP